MRYVKVKLKGCRLTFWTVQDAGSLRKEQRWLCGAERGAALGLSVVVQVWAAAKLLGNERSPSEDCVGSLYRVALMVLISTKQLCLLSPSTVVSTVFYRQEAQARGDVRTDLGVGAVVCGSGALFFLWLLHLQIAAPFLSGEIRW